MCEVSELEWIFNPFTEKERGVQEEAPRLSGHPSDCPGRVWDRVEWPRNPEWGRYFHVWRWVSMKSA